MSAEVLNFKNADYRRFDNFLAEKGWGVYPEKWHQFWTALDRKIKDSGQEIRLENPLILGGSMASELSKRHRFIGHLLVAERAGFLEWALEYLARIEANDWAGLVNSHPVFPHQKQPILYITGRGGSLDRGYATVLKERCLDFDGVELNGDFLKLDHVDQTTVISEILKQYSESTIIANSYGAYLVLYSLASQKLDLNNVFFHSPVTGSAMLEGTYFRPAGARVVEAAISECKFIGTIKNLTVVVGSDDIQCDPQRCQLMAAAFHGRATVIPNQGHQISSNKLEKFTDEFFSSV